MSIKVSMIKRRHEPTTRHEINENIEAQKGIIFRKVGEETRRFFPIYQM